MTTDMRSRDIFHDYEDFLVKKRQYAKAVHVFHDQTSKYDDQIDHLPVGDMAAHQKEYLQHERDFHDVMDSFERSMENYQLIISEIKNLKRPVTGRIGKKDYSLQVIKDEIVIKEIEKK